MRVTDLALTVKNPASVNARFRVCVIVWYRILVFNTRVSYLCVTTSFSLQCVSRRRILDRPCSILALEIEYNMEDKRQIRLSAGSWREFENLAPRFRDLLLSILTDTEQNIFAINQTFQSK